MPALADPTNAYNQQHVYILYSLDEYKSIVLVTDVDNADSLIVPLFTLCFDIVSGSGKNAAGVEVSKSVEYHLKRLLATVVEEATLPQDVTDIILSQFLRVDPRNTQGSSSKVKRGRDQDDKQGTLLLKDYPPAYNMAKSVCTACPDKMTAAITQYFGTVIVDATASAQTNGHHKHIRRISDIDVSDDDEEDLADLRKAHRLLRELWRACPDVLANVIPQIEAELDADSEALRQLATETLADIAAGVGIAGLPPPSTLDPTAYPLPSIEDGELVPSTSNPLLTPASPKPFATVHGPSYQKFLTRRQDKSVAVRSAWAIGVGRILLTSAGGIGLSEAERQELLTGFAQILRDSDERVRLAGIKAVAFFGYHAIINVLAADGGMSQPNTVISNLADRVKDVKNNVREEAYKLLARIWGVASADIEQGQEVVTTTIGQIPNRLFEAFYTNNLHINAALDKALYEGLVPISFPPIKVQISRTDSQKQRAKDREGGSQEALSTDPDAIRVRRILTLIRCLDAKPRAVFYGMQKRQVQMQTIVTRFLKSCEEYNGGVVEDDLDEEKIKKELSAYIEGLSKQFPDAVKVSTDLWKFAKLHNRRDYQLIRFASGPEHDYRTMSKAIKELTKRIREGPSSTQSMIETLTPLLYKCALFVYNRSHVPAVMEVSRSDEDGLAETAHQLLKEISMRNPEVLKSHIQALCRELEENAPSASKSEDASASETLKACSGFARKYPKEMTKERKFLTALTNFALYSHSPRAAKHAVSIVFAVADKKELYAKEILSKATKDCSPSSPYYLARLATISQICLLAAPAANAERDTIVRIAVADTLQQNRSTNTDAESTWSTVPTDETLAKELALKIMVNLCRSTEDKDNHQELDDAAKVVYKMLMRLITEDGEMSPSKNTPPAQKNYLRLAAARFMLKLCSHKRRCEELLTPAMFISTAMIVINPPNAVRSGFIHQLKKYLGQNRLSHRWYTVMFLIAFEPDIELRTSTLVWLKSRAQYFVRQQQQAAKSNDGRIRENVMEYVFARVLSLLAHHPDYPEKDSEDFDSELLDFAKYIVFYLMAVATEDNISLLFHVAQRVKQAKDGVDGLEDCSERIYVLSDLAQNVIRNYADQMSTHSKGVNILQTWPGKAPLPGSLFKALPSHDKAQEIAENHYLPEEVALGLEKLVRSYTKSFKSGASTAKKHTTVEKKRKNSDVMDLDDEEEVERKKPVKRAKRPTNLPIRKTPKPKRKSSEIPSSELPSRKSARHSNAVSYVESDSEEDDVRMVEEDKIASSPAAKRAEKPRTAIPNKAREEVHDESDSALSELEVDEGDLEDKAVADDSAPEVEQDGNDDAVMTDPSDDEKENDDVPSGEQEASEDIEEEVASDRETTPSPLKEKANAKTGKNAKGKAKAVAKPSPAVVRKAAPTTKGKAKSKEKSSPPVTTRRETRRTRT